MDKHDHKHNQRHGHGQEHQDSHAHAHQNKQQPSEEVATVENAAQQKEKVNERQEHHKHK